MKSNSTNEQIVQFAKSVLLEKYGFVFDEMNHGYVAVVRKAYDNYRYLIDELGVAPEMARMVLPQSMMVNWIWTGSLYAFARVVNQRLDSHAQRECRPIVLDIAAAMRDRFPVSAKALLAQ